MFSGSQNAKKHVKTIYENMSTPIEHELKELKIRCLLQWYSQERQDVGHAHKPREENKYVGKYIN